MKKNVGLLLTFARETGDVLPERKLTAVPLREDAVLALSVEFFDDPEPCMIHRSAVMSRMYMELHEYFHAALLRGVAEHALDALPQRLSSFLDVSGCTTTHVRIEAFT